MNNDYETRERILTEAMQELKQQASTVIEGIMGNLYHEYLPHVVSDTEANLSYRVQGCVKNILQGKVEIVDGHPDMFYVNDSYGSDHLISLGYYFDWKLLVDAMGDTVQTNRIKQLEAEVENLTARLAEAYRRY